MPRTTALDPLFTAVDSGSFTDRHLATIAGHPAFGGTLREINAGALIHYDDINREFPTGRGDRALPTRQPHTPPR